MTQQEIQERNKQIALMLSMTNDAFLLEKNIESNTGLCHLKFHSDWNWLHEGIKFLQKHFESKELVWTTIERYPLYSNIEDVFLMISDFAKLYNEKKL